MTEIKGLARAREIYQDRPCRVKELSAEGKKVIGYFCIYPVVEMLTALDLVPYRIFGNMYEPITKADACLPTIVCPFIRSSLDIALKGEYDFLDGVIFAHSCEVAEKTAHIWDIYKRPGYFHFIDTPHTTHKAAVEHHKELLIDFKRSLEQYTGQEITTDKLKQAITISNQQRALVRELYDLRKPEPPLISGSEILQTLKVVMSLPMTESNQLLQEVIAEVKQRHDGPEQKSARLLMWGSIVDDTPLVDMIEQLDANLVMDDTCVGSRPFLPDVKLTDDPLDGLAQRYLVELKCPRTFREAVMGQTKKDYMSDLASRFGYLKNYIEQWRINGVLLVSLRYCDIHGYEVPGLRDYLDSIDIPSIYLEYNYSEASLAPLRTRVEAFLETLG